MKLEKRAVKGFPAVLLFGVLCFSMPVQASGPLISGIETESKEAEGPARFTEQVASSDQEEEMEYEEEALLDSCIEYKELEALIRIGNASALNQQSSYSKKKEMYQTAYDALLSERRQMLNEAEKLEEENGEEAQIAFYEQNAQILSNSAKQMKRTLNSLQSSSNEASRNKTVWSIVKSAQTLFASCKQMENQTQTAQKNVEASQAAYERKQMECQAGIATEDQLLTAEKSLLSAQISFQSAKDSELQLKRQLNRLLGIASNTDLSGEEGVTLGELPAVTEEELSAIDLEADKALAIIANSAVKSVKNSSAKGDASRKLRVQQLEEAEGNAALTADEQYAALAAASLTREGAKAAWEAAQRDYHALQTKYQAGITNKGTYLSGEASYLQKKAAYVAAEAELRLAYDSYKWMLKGVN